MVVDLVAVDLKAVDLEAGDLEAVDRDGGAIGAQTQFIGYIVSVGMLKIERITNRQELRDDRMAGGGRQLIFA